MPDLSWAPLARLDLVEIDGFLIERDGAAAARILRAIRQSAERLIAYPKLGRPFRDELRVLGVRGTQYILVYRLNGQWIEVARIRHRREDWAIGT